MNYAKKLMILNIIFRIAIFSLLPGLFLTFSTPVEAANGLDQSIRQVKTADSPVVFYLDHKKGIKKAYTNEKAFLSYGNKWSDIKTISSGELSKWSDINLVKTAGNSAVYYINAGKKALITSAGEFLKAGFKWSDVATINKTDLSTYALTEFKVGGGSADNTNNTNNSRLTVGESLIVSNGSTLPIGTKDNLVAIFNLRAEKEAVEIKSLTLKFTGIFNPESLDKIYLTNEAGAVYDNIPSIENRKAIFNFYSNPLLIQTGEEKKIKVFVNFTDKNTVGTTFGVAIAGQTDIETGSKIMGTFPVGKNIFKLVDGSGVLGQIKAEENLVDVTDATIGNTAQTVNKFTIYETSGKENLLVKEITLVSKGTSGKANLVNFKLNDKYNNIVSTVSAMDTDKNITFKLNDYKISKKDNINFSVTADITGGENQTVNLDLKEIKAVGAEYGFSLKPAYTNNSQTITIKRKALAVITKELKESKNVFAEQKGAIIGVFEIRNNNQKINFGSLYFSLVKNNSTANLSKTIFLVNYDSGKVYGSFSGEKFSSGQASVDLSVLSLNSKESLNLALITDIPKEIKNGDSYKIVLNKINYIAETGASYSDEVNVSGASLSVSKASVYIYTNKEVKNLSYSKGQKGVRIASFIVETASGSDAIISSLTLARGNTSGAIVFTNGFTNLKADIGGRGAKNIIEKPSDNEYVFTGFDYRLGAGQRVEVNIYVDTERDLKVNSTDLKITSLNAIAYNSTIAANVSGLGATSAVANFLEIQGEISNVNAGNIVPGEKENVAGSFKIKNTGGEDLRLANLVINTASEGFSYSLGYSNLKIEERGTNRGIGSIGRPVAGANKIGLGNYKIIAGQEQIFDVYVDASDEVPSGNISIYFSDLEVYGYNSGIKANISGDPTSNYNFNIAAKTSAGFVRPVSGDITYGFHDPKYPFDGDHTGIDIAVSQGTGVKATTAGTVIEAVDGGASGYSYIVIRHKNNLSTVYGHLSKVGVKAGEEVDISEIIGLSGGAVGAPGSGSNTTGPHLHFEVRLNGAAVDPVNYL